MIPDTLSIAVKLTVIVFCHAGLLAFVIYIVHFFFVTLLRLDWCAYKRSPVRRM